MAPPGRRLDPAAHLDPGAGKSEPPPGAPRAAESRLPPTAARPVELFGALADPIRFELVRRLEERGPLSVGELARGLPVTRSAISQHLRVLREANLVQADRQGRQVHYSLAGGSLDPLSDWISRYRRFESERAEAGPEGRPHMRLASATVTVADQDRSLVFYRDTLGFSVVNDRRAAGIRWLSLAPPDGTAVVVLRAASSARDLPYSGSWTGLMFMTDDIAAKFRELTGRGVTFDAPRIATLGRHRHHLRRHRRQPLRPRRAAEGGSVMGCRSTQRALQ